MRTFDLILREGKERWLAEGERRKAIEQFRRNAERSIPGAIVCLVLGLALGLLAVTGVYLYLSVSTNGHGSVSDILQAVQTVIYAGVACYFLWMGLRKIWVSPRDRVLLLLVEEVLMKEEKAPLPTPASVTPPAAQEPRQP